MPFSCENIAVRDDLRVAHVGVEVVEQFATLRNARIVSLSGGPDEIVRMLIKFFLAVFGQSGFWVAKP